MSGSFAMSMMLAFNQGVYKMVRCKDCKAIIAVGFEDCVNGEMPMPEKKYSNLGIKLCDDCARKAIGVKQS